MLSGCLLFSGVTSALGLAASTFLLNAMMKVTPDADIHGADAEMVLWRKVMLFCVFICAGNVACVAAAWSWKRWGVYGIIALQVLATMVALKAGMTLTLGSWLPTIVLSTLALVRWSDFE